MCATPKSLQTAFTSAVLLLFLLYDVEPVRRTLKKMPSWRSVGMTLKRSLGV